MLAIFNSLKIGHESEILAMVSIISDAWLQKISVAYQQSVIASLVNVATDGVFSKSIAQAAKTKLQQVQLQNEIVVGLLSHSKQTLASNEDPNPKRSKSQRYIILTVLSSFCLTFIKR